MTMENFGMICVSIVLALLITMLAAILGAALPFFTPMGLMCGVVANFVYLWLEDR